MKSGCRSGPHGDLLAQACLWPSCQAQTEPLPSWLHQTDKSPARPTDLIHPCYKGKPEYGPRRSNVQTVIVLPLCGVCKQAEREVLKAEMLRLQAEQAASASAALRARMARLRESAAARSQKGMTRQSSADPPSGSVTARARDSEAGEPGAAKEEVGFAGENTVRFPAGP